MAPIPRDVMTCPGHIATERFTSGWFPLLRPAVYFLNILFPVIEKGRIKIRSVGPLNGVNFRINLNFLKEHFIAQLPIHLTPQDRLKVNCFFGSVIKSDADLIKTGNVD